MNFRIPSDIVKRDWAREQTRQYWKDNRPLYVYRKDDGVRFTRQSNNKYTTDESAMNPKYEYDLAALTGPAFTLIKSEIKIVEYKTINDGHGDEDDCC